MKTSTIDRLARLWRAIGSGYSMFSILTATELLGDEARIEKRGARNDWFASPLYQAP